MIYLLTLEILWHFGALLLNVHSCETGGFSVLQFPVVATQMD